MFVGVADPELVAVGKIMKNAARSEKVMRGIRNGLSKRAEAERLRRSDRIHIHDALLIQQVFIQRQQETRVFAVAEGPGD